MRAYTPPQKILNKYADVLVNFALHSGKGVKANEVVECVVPDVAKPLALALQNTLLQAKAHPIIRLVPTGFDKDYFTLASKKQRTFFPKDYYEQKVSLLDHMISIIADPYPVELVDIDSKKILESRAARYPYREALFAKELRKQFTWTLGLWGVPAKAEMVGLSMEKYWEQIIHACFLDYENPVAEWKLIQKKQKSLLQQLNDLRIASVQLKGPDVDLTIQLGANRVWKGGSGSNIPSFELFTSPDWRGTEGWIQFNQPLYRYGTVIENIRLVFKQGRVIEASASKNQTDLQNMIKTKNADKVGEFSLTDKSMSRITHPMAETLFDENIGGPEGNTHIAVGMAYKDCYRGDSSQVTTDEWEAMGYNNSTVHTDMVSTTERTVTATLTDGTTKVIYAGGKFTL